MSKRKFYIDYTNPLYACSIEWVEEQYSIKSTTPFIDYIRCDLNGEDYEFLNSTEMDFEEVDLFDFEPSFDIKDKAYILCYKAIILIDLEKYPIFMQALSFSVNQIEVVLGFKYRNKVIDDCYQPVRDFSVPLLTNK